MANTVDAPAALRQADQDAGQMLAHTDQNAQQQLAQARDYPAGRNLGMLPRTLEEAVRFAQLIAVSEMVPKDYRNKPANVLTSIMFGQDVGLSPMQALQSIANINGRPSLWGDGFLAVVMSLQQYKDHEECYVVDGKEVDFITADDLKKDATMAVARFWRKGRTKPFVATFSVADAKKANLLGKDGPWQQYPQRMMKYRARGFAARDAFPDGLRGIQLAEESQDIPGEVITSEVVPMPMRASATAPAANSGGATTVGGPSTAGTAAAGNPAPATTTVAPPSPSPARPLYRLKKVWKVPSRSSVAKGPFWYASDTENGLHVHTYDETKGELLLRAAEGKGSLALTLAPPDEQGRQDVLDIVIIDAVTGEQQS